MNLQIAKILLKNFCKARIQNAILLSYPIHTQMNMTNGIEDGVEDMKSFIQTKIDDFDLIKADIDALESTDVFDNFETASDAEMCAYVTQHFESLTTNDQKLVVASAIQGVIAKLKTAPIV